MATIKFKDTLQNCLKDSEFKAEFESLKPEFQIKSALIAKRLAKKLTQAQILDYLKSIKQELQKDGIVELGLFGSYAKGVAKENSDIDVFIRYSDEFRKKYLGFKAFIYLGELRERLENHFGLSVDLCNLNAFNNKEKQENFFKGAIYV